MSRSIAASNLCLAIVLLAINGSHAARADTPDSSQIDGLSKAEAPTLATVKPPKQPTISRSFISEKKLAELPEAVQPQALTEALTALTTGTIDERKAKLKTKVLADLVYVRGGKFMMGDFAKLMGVPGTTRMTYNEDDKIIHEVTLSDFWISKYKTTYAEYDVYADATGKPKNGLEFNGEYHQPLTPVGAQWQQAQDYCRWLGRLTSLPIDLPTEAQWEYAARSRGQFFAIGTDNGHIDYGRNIPYELQQEWMAQKNHTRNSIYPIGMFPPNPLGLYDISHNGEEWVADWYADTYKKASSVNPKGPSSGVKKVMRGWGGDTLKIGVNVWRRKDLPVPMSRGVLDEANIMKPMESPFLPGIRCAVAP